MRMKIATLWRNHETQDYELLRLPNTIERHGWDSPADYVRECSRRFRHRNPKPYRNGLEMRGDAGTIQRIWFD